MPWTTEITAFSARAVAKLSNPNVVASCGPCNLAKGSQTLKQAAMHLRRKPFRPTPEQLQNTGRKFPPNHLHDSWMDYLYWDAELEA